MFFTKVKLCAVEQIFKVLKEIYTKHMPQTIGTTLEIIERYISHGSKWNAQGKRGKRREAASQCPRPTGQGSVALSPSVKAQRSSSKESYMHRLPK